MDTSELQEQLAEAQAQIESLQSVAADAEARAATLGEKAARLESELLEAQTASRSAQERLTELQVQLEEAQSQLREALSRYRAVRLAAAPEVPADLVPEATSLAEIDASFRAAQEMADRLREQMKGGHPPTRVPAGSAARRAPDLSSLSPTEKIRLGLRERWER